MDWGETIPVKSISIREIPDHATFRIKERAPVLLDKLGSFLSIALCDLAKFYQLYLPKYIIT